MLSLREGTIGSRVIAMATVGKSRALSAFYGDYANCRIARPAFRKSRAARRSTNPKSQRDDLPPARRFSAGTSVTIHDKSQRDDARCRGLQSPCPSTLRLAVRRFHHYLTHGIESVANPISMSRHDEER